MKVDLHGLNPRNVHLNNLNAPVLNVLNCQQHDESSSVTLNIKTITFLVKYFYTFSISNSYSCESL